MDYILSQISLWVASVLTLLGTVLGGFSEPSVQSNVLTGTTTALVTKIIDGDTIDVRLASESNSIRVRYIGVDTPEPYAHEIPDCGSAEATKRNKELVDGQIITLVPGTEPYDRYGRLLAYVYVGDMFINETLVADGYATVLMIPPNTAYKKTFVDLYHNAQNTKRGIWAVCGSE
jgi:micrococcal nuclease